MTFSLMSLSYFCFLKIIFPLISNIKENSDGLKNRVTQTKPSFKVVQSKLYGQSMMPQGKTPSKDPSKAVERVFPGKMPSLKEAVTSLTVHSV